jgi:rSAM/selenodomain-associated transferase 1
MTWNESAAFCGVAVMAKASYPGRTKTRLSPPLSMEEAADFNTAFLKDVADNLSAAACSASLAGSMAYGPPGSEAFFREILPRSIALHEVWWPNFGDCLKQAMQKQFDAGHKAACVLNSDSPTLPVALLVEMVDVLAQPGDRAVLGPSTDGGYYLLACKRQHGRLFEDIAWSTDAVARQTLDRAAEIGLRVHILPRWYDVDDCASIRLLAREVLNGQGFSPALRSSPARHSADLLRTLFSASDLSERLDAFETGAGDPPLKMEEALA